MHSKPQKRTAERLTCRESWKGCLPAKTKARARMPPPFLQLSCVLRSRVEAVLSNNLVADPTVNHAANQISRVKFVAIQGRCGWLHPALWMGLSYSAERTEA